MILKKSPEEHKLIDVVIDLDKLIYSTQGNCKIGKNAKATNLNIGILVEETN